MLHKDVEMLRRCRCHRRQHAARGSLHGAGSSGGRTADDSASAKQDGEHTSRPPAPLLSMQFLRCGPDAPSRTASTRPQASRLRGAESSQLAANNPRPQNQALAPLHAHANARPGAAASRCGRRWAEVTTWLAPRLRPLNHLPEFTSASRPDLPRSPVMRMPAPAPGVGRPGCTGRGAARGRSTVANAGSWAAPSSAVWLSGCIPS